MGKCNCGTKLMHEVGCKSNADGPARLPVIKEDGYLWYVDFRLGEKREVHTGRRDRFDSGGFSEFYYKKILKDGEKFVVVDCDGENKGE